MFSRAERAAASQLGSDCRVDGRLLAAFGSLSGGGAAPAATVALRCEEMLRAMAPVLQA